MSSDGKIHFRCPHCTHTVAIAAVHAGKRGKCPGCGQVIDIPTGSTRPAVPSDSIEALIARSMEELQIKSAAHDQLWGLGDSSWDVDQDQGKIVFTSPRGMTTVCPVQIIGTLNTNDGSWLWGWDHPSVEPALQQHAQLCRTYGERHGIDWLVCQRLEECTEDDGWQMVALACNLAGAQGAYRGPMGATLVFMTFGQPQISRTQ